MTPFKEIVVSEINRYYKSEKAIYEDILAVSAMSWYRWKKGDHGFNKEGMDQIKAFFTEYEWMIVEKLSRNMAMRPQNVDNEPFEQYIQTKKNIAKHWAEEATMSVSTSRNVDGSDDRRVNPGVRLTVSMNYDGWVDSITFYAPSGTQIPAGKRNRYEWFVENSDVLF